MMRKIVKRRRKANGSRYPHLLKPSMPRNWVVDTLLPQVHRLDQDSSGILVMGRTQTSAAILHSVFRKESLGASKHDFDNEKRVLQKKYWALVIGSPRRPKGTISAPLRKLRVHCAEVFGTPIVGDYKYGWQAHRRLQNLAESNLIRKKSNEKVSENYMLPFGISEQRLRLHLHCREIILPNVSEVLRNMESFTDDDLAKLESLEIVAPLPSYMQKSWDILNY